MLADFVEAVFNRIAGNRIRFIQDAFIQRKGAGSTIGPCIVRIGTNIQRIGAGIQLIAAEIIQVRIVVVIGCHGVRIDCNRHSLTFTGRKQLGLGKTSQHNMCLFDFTSQIRRGSIQLNNILTGYRTGVGYGHFHIDLCVTGNVGVFRELRIPLEGGVAQTIAERIDHVLSIPFLAIAETTGLIITIADIDAFFILDHMILGRFTVFKNQRIVGGIGTAIFGIDSKVLPGRRGCEIRRISINRTAGRVHCTVQDLTQCFKAGYTGAACPQDCVHTFVSLNRTKLQRSAGIQHDYNLVKILLGKGNQILLVLIQFKIVFACIIATRNDGFVAFLIHQIGSRGQIVALAADTGNEHQRSVSIISAALLFCVRISLHRRFSYRIAAGHRTLGRRSRAGAAGFFSITIESLHHRVDGKACLPKAVIHINLRHAAAS